jgi:hypothetical protein
LAPLACKTDKIDARVLAELSFRDLVPAIWLPTPELRARAVAAAPDQAPSILKNRVHADLIAFGHQVPTADLFGVAGSELLADVRVLSAQRVQRKPRRGNSTGSELAGGLQHHHGTVAVAGAATPRRPRGRMRRGVDGLQSRHRPWAGSVPGIRGLIPMLHRRRAPSLSYSRERSCDIPARTFSCAGSIAWHRPVYDLSVVSWPLSAYSSGPSR